MHGQDLMYFLFANNYINATLPVYCSSPFADKEFYIKNVVLDGFFVWVMYFIVEHS
jgi:hypothetical protein